MRGDGGWVGGGIQNKMTLWSFGKLALKLVGRGQFIFTLTQKHIESIEA